MLFESGASMRLESRVMKKKPKPDAAPPSARFDFNKAARKAMKDHPELRGNTLFIDAANTDFAEIKKALLEKDVDEEDIKDLAKTVRDAKRLKTAFHQEYDWGRKKPLHVIIFHPDKHPVFGKEHGERDDAGTFDHETGHALSPHATGTLAENTADAYAALRNIQRFGGDTADLDYAGWKRAAIFILSGVTSHLTTLTLDKIVCDAATADFISLTPAETLRIAEEYAKLNTPSEERLKKLKEDFSGLKGLALEDTFRKVAAATLAAKEDSDTFYVGARVLQGALQKGGQKLDGRHIELKGGEWDDVREKLSEKTSALPQQHPLRRAA